MEPEDYRRLKELVNRKNTWTRQEIAEQLKQMADQEYINGLWDIKLPGLPKLDETLSKQQAFVLIALTLDMTRDKTLEKDGRRLKCKLKELRRRYL